MKLNNLKQAHILTERLNRVESAIIQANQFLKEKTKNSHGTDCGGDKGLYQLHVSEFRDNSGLKVDLSDCAIGIEVLDFILGQLECKQKEIIAEIEKL